MRHRYIKAAVIGSAVALLFLAGWTYYVDTARIPVPGFEFCADEDDLVAQEVDLRAAGNHQANLEEVWQHGRVLLTCQMFLDKAPLWTLLGLWVGISTQRYADRKIPKSPLNEAN